MPFFQIRDDITHLHVEAVVNPANEMLLEGDGTSRAIYRAAGEDQLAKACAEIGYCKTGEAVITSGFDLSQWIIHASGPTWNGGYEHETELLRDTYLSCLKLCEEYCIESVAFPLLSSGFCGFPKMIAIETAALTISDYLKDHDDLAVYLVFYEEESLELGKRIFRKIVENIDEEYVLKNDEIVPDGRFERIIKEEFRRRKHRDDHAYQMLSMSVSSESREFTDEINAYAESVLPKKKRREPMFFGSLSLDDLSIDGVEELLKRNEETFSEMVLRIIDENGWKDTDVYKRVGIDRKLFSKIRSDKEYSPSRKVALLLCIALKLNIDQARDLLMKGGYAFSDVSKTDMIIQCCIEEGEYNINEINMLLYDCHLRPLTTK